MYFNEAHETAKSAVAETLDLYNGLLGTLEESERGKLQRSMGLKMEQLKVSHCQPHTLPVILDLTPILNAQLTILLRHYVVCH